MPAYFGNEMSQQELQWQHLADDEALRFVRSGGDPEIARAVLRAGVPVAMWEVTVARARRYLSAP